MSDLSNIGHPRAWRRSPSGAARAPSGRSRPRGRLLLDAVARRVVTTGGITIIVSILAILFVIAAQVVPLFRKPTAEAGTELSGFPRGPHVVRRRRVPRGGARSHP